MKLGPYELREEIGRGGAGAVFRARSPGGRELAVKILHGAKPDGLARFDRERRLLAAFSEEDGFVPLLDAGADGRASYIVMPFLPGGTLRRRLADGPLGLAETIALARSLASALGRAHERGIVHRDVKPENVLFTADGRPLLADLGLAKHFDLGTPGASQSIQLSRRGEMRGTAGYMAPEQMSDATAVGPPADVFALGAVLWECLAGTPAFQGESIVEVLARVQKRLPKRVSSARPDAPRWLAAAIERALDPDPEERFEDGAAFARALDPNAPQKPRRRRRFPVFVALVPAFAALAWIALRPPHSREAQEPPPPPALRTEVVDPAPLRSEVFARVVGRLVARAYPAAVDECRRAAEKSGDPWLRALEADCRLDAGDVEGALAIVASWTEGTPGEARALGVRGFVRARRGELEAARADAERALRLDPKLPRANMARFLLLVRGARANSAEGDELVQQADAASLVAIQNAPPCLATARVARSDLLKATADQHYKDFLDPEVYFDTRADRLKLAPARLDPGTEAFYIATARSLLDEDQPAAALEAARKASALDPLRPIAHALEARALGELKDAAAASEAWTRARRLDSKDPVILMMLANDLYYDGSYREAAAAVDAALALDPSIAGWMLRASIDTATADDRHAIVSLEHAVEVDRTSHTAWEGLALARLGLGDLEGAMTAANAAVSQAETPTVWCTRSKVLLARGEVALALEAANRAVAFGRNPDAFTARAAVHLARKALDEAARDCDEAFACRAGWPPALRVRGLVRSERGDRKGARGDLAEYLSSLPPASTEAAQVRAMVAKLD